MNCVKDKDIPLVYQLASEMLGLSSIEELDYYEVEHVIALSLAVNEVYARAGAGATKYWESICELFRWGDIDSYEISERVCENSSNGCYEIDICDCWDLENIAFYTMEHVEDKLSIGKGYFNLDLTMQVADIVYKWQYHELKKKK